MRRESRTPDRAEAALVAWVRQHSAEQVAARLRELDDALGDAIDKWEDAERRAANSQAGAEQ